MTLLPPLLLSLGLFCIWWSFWPCEERVVKPSTPTWRDKLSDAIAQSGLGSISTNQLLAVSLGLGVLVFLLAMASTSVVPISFAFALISGYAPIAFVQGRARRRRTQMRELWPDVVDHIASAVRAGMALPESLSQLSVRGPEELRPAFLEFAHDYRATGNFQSSLDALKLRLSDPVADRLIESLRIAREVGGTDLGRLLRTLSSFLRDDGRTRSELEARQSWTVNAARLALAAPWIVLAMLATRGTSLQAYQKPTGVVVLIVGAAVSMVAYRIMRQIGRLPDEARVMR
ncbi:type II secretion system F family protein [Allobranchiibius sp. GilTou73]|uniref:type II secretion system F family protein n=1 Tax=Allobranchiibius sp. GilTou73 TaxID=2904523 RepID=UPI001F40F97C|nr:type II secretion system F family protein [Allobranchiibius sp. GilTou73]UIJ34704.1 type II secretion system F family protein [Allobranchiibius sp. GilTou73]